MGKTPQTSQVIRFATFEVDLQGRQLRKSGLKVRLQDQPFHILELLLERPGELLTRDELREKLWPSDTFVDFDHSLHTAITKLREALGDEADNPRFIETLPRHGYRFLGQLIAQPAEAVSVPEKRNYRLLAAAILLPALLAASIFGFDLGGARTRLFFRADALPQVSCVAVLPFANLSQEQQEEYFADGVTEALTTDLARIKSLRVISRTSAARYKGSRKALPEIARDLGADVIVEGAVVRTGDRVRVTTQVIRASTDEHIWADAFERKEADILALQADLSRSIARQIHSVLLPPAANPKSIDPQVYEAYLRSRFYVSKANLEDSPEPARVEEDYRLALTYANQAIELDPKSPFGYIGVARAEARRCSARGFILKTSTLPHSRDAARRAVELEETLAEAHLAMGDVLMAEDWNWPAAEKEFRRALELNPQNVEVLLDYSLLLTHLGHFNEALDLAREATILDPLSLKATTNLSYDQFQARRFDDSLKSAKTVLELQPESFFAQMMAAWNYAMKKMPDEATQQCKHVMQLTSESPASLVFCAWVYGKVGRVEEARNMVRRAQQKAAPYPLDPGMLSFGYAGTGQKELALASVEQAFEKRSGNLTVLKVAPGFDELRSEPRFQAVLRKMNFPQ